MDKKEQVARKLAFQELYDPEITRFTTEDKVWEWVIKEGFVCEWYGKAEEICQLFEPKGEKKRLLAKVAEIEETQGEINKKLDDVEFAIEQARQEVAAEIFEEIDKVFPGLKQPAYRRKRLQTLKDKFLKEGEKQS